MKIQFFKKLSPNLDNIMRNHVYRLYCDFLWFQSKQADCLLRLKFIFGLKANILDLLDCEYTRIFAFNSNQMKYKKPNIPNIRNRSSKNEKNQI